MCLRLLTWSTLLAAALTVASADAAAQPLGPMPPPAPAPFVTGCTTTGAIAFDDANVYWATDANVLVGNTDPNAVWTVPRTGGTPRQLMTTRGPVDLAIDETDVFVAQNFDQRPINIRQPHWQSWIAKVPKAGGAPVVIVKDRPNPKNIHVDAKRVYWADNAGIHSASKDGTNVVTLYARSRVAMIADADALYVREWTGNGINGESATGPVERGGRVLRIAKQGGPPKVLASGLLEIQSAAVDATHLYLSTASSYDLHNGELVRIDKATGARTTLARRQEWARTVAVDDARLYFPSPAGIMSVPKKAGGTPSLWLAGTQPNSLAVSKGAVFVSGSISAAQGPACRGKFGPNDPGQLLWGASAP